MALCYQCFREKGAETVCPFCGYDPTGSAKKHPMALRPESILNGRYIVGRVLGQGGFGITYVAQDYQTGQRVAIKEYFPTEFAGAARTGPCAVYSADREGGLRLRQGPVPGGGADPGRRHRQREHRPHPQLL